MAAAGIDPKAVKTIVISHFHGDHISGLMAKETNAQMFPDAEIIVPAAELKWWTQSVDAIPKARQGLAQRIQATFPTWKNVKPIDGEADVAPGIRAIPAHGHTQGHTAHLISSGGRQLLVTADATNIQALFVKNPEWQAAFDHVPDQAVETRKKLFDRAITDKAMVAGYHWGLPNVGTIAKDGNGYAFYTCSVIVKHARRSWRRGRSRKGAPQTLAPSFCHEEAHHVHHARWIGPLATCKRPSLDGRALLPPAVRRAPACRPYPAFRLLLRTWSP